MDEYIAFGNEISPEIMSFDISNGLYFFKTIKSKLEDKIKICVIVKLGTSTEGLDDFFR